MRLGYHTDWASSFPFETLALPDNYAIPSPAVALFGFTYDASFEQTAGARLAAGAIQAERDLAARAAAAHLNLDACRRVLQERYRKVVKTASPILHEWRPTD